MSETVIPVRGKLIWQQQENCTLWGGLLKVWHPSQRSKTGPEVKSLNMVRDGAAERMAETKGERSTEFVEAKS